MYNSFGIMLIILSCEKMGASVEGIAWSPRADTDRLTFDQDDVVLRTIESVCSGGRE